MSNNGKDFSMDGKRFKYIPIDQLLTVYPTAGPESGGTVVSITIVDLPYTLGISGDYVDIAKCLFPGYPAQRAQWISPQLIRCTTPRLIENIDNVTSATSFAVATVYIEIIGRVNSKFFFVYSKDLHVRALDPDNGYVDQADTPVKVFGVNFMPVGHLIQCKLFFETPLVVTGRYLNNHTVECDIPPPPI